MPFTKVRDVNLYYEISGERGPCVVLMSGGRSDHTRLQELGRRIAAGGYRVLSHDRRNCGLSDLVIDGDDAEYEIWADDLYALLQQLELAPAFVAGASSGCRTAIVFALRHPQAVRGLLLLRITGGPFAAHHLAEEYYGQFIAAAEADGMQAVCALGHFKERIAAKPANRDYLLALSPERFIGQMKRWQAYYLEGADLPVIGATEAELRSIVAPTVVISGNDRTHPRDVAYNFAKLLPNATIHEVMGPQRDIVRTSPEEWDAKIDDIAAIFLGFLNEASAQPGRAT